MVWRAKTEIVVERSVDTGWSVTRKSWDEQGKLLAMDVLAPTYSSSSIAQYTAETAADNFRAYEEGNSRLLTALAGCYVDAYGAEYLSAEYSDPYRGMTQYWGKILEEFGVDLEALQAEAKENFNWEDPQSSD